MDARFGRRDVWFTSGQIAKILGRESSVVSRILRRAIRDGELDRQAMTARFRSDRVESGRTVTAYVDHFNLDAVIAVGLRVRSREGARFRNWASAVLRQRLLRSEPRAEQSTVEQALASARESLAALVLTLKHRSDSEGVRTEAGTLIAEYAQTWHLLDQYDQGRLREPRGTLPTTGDWSMAAWSTLSPNSSST